MGTSSISASAKVDVKSCCTWCMETLMIGLWLPLSGCTFYMLPSLPLSLGNTWQQLGNTWQQDPQAMLGLTIKHWPLSTSRAWELTTPAVATSSSTSGTRPQARILLLWLEKYALDLHPDKKRVNQWMDWRGIKDEELQRTVKRHLSQFHPKWSL